MESKKFLKLMMKKVEESKNNPMKQKNLKKMFTYYSSLKRKEQAKKMIKNTDNSDNYVWVIQVIDSNKTDEQRSTLQISEQNMDSNEEEIQSISFSDEISVSNNKINLTTPKSNTVNVTQMSEINANKFKIDNESDEETEYEIEYLETMDATDNGSLEYCSANNQIMKHDIYGESKEIAEETSTQNSLIDEFLLQLGERLKKLPYRTRSKLEIEFLRRLFELQECLNLLDD